MKICLNDAERDALKGLPWMVQSLYTMALRPRMDFSTGVVGDHSYISHNTLSMDLVVEGAPGITAERPSKDQIRRALKALERAGLLVIISGERRLRVRLLLAEIGPKKAEKAAIKPPYQTATEAAIPPSKENPEKSGGYSHQDKKAAIEAATSENNKAATPISGIRLLPQLKESSVDNSNCSGTSKDSRSGSAEGAPDIPPQSEVEKAKPAKPKPSSKPDLCLEAAKAAIDYLNERADRDFKPSKTSLRHPLARLREGFTGEDLGLVIDHRVQQWLGDPMMEQYLRPQTLFDDKFEGYLQAARAAIKNPVGANNAEPGCLHRFGGHEYGQYHRSSKPESAQQRHWRLTAGGRKGTFLDPDCSG